MTAIIQITEMYERFGFTATTAGVSSGAQDMDYLEKLSLLTDDEVDALCKLVRSPGDMIANPSGRGVQIQEPGCDVSIRDITNLKLA